MNERSLGQHYNYDSEEEEKNLKWYKRQGSP